MLTQLQDMDLQLIRIFVTIVDSGGFSAAQGKLGVAQSTISTQMSKLETRLGFRLCERGKSGFRLTPKGENVYQSSLKLLDAVDSFTRDTQAASGSLLGELKIGLSEFLPPNVLEQIGDSLKEFRVRAPEVIIEIVTDTPDELESKLVNNKLNLAIGYFSKSQTSLNYFQLFKEKQSLYCSKSHTLFQEQKVKPEHIARINKVSHSYKGSVNDFRLASEKVTAICERVEADLIFILSGAHISFLPVHLAEPWVEAGKLRELAAEEFSYDVEFQLATAKRYNESDILAEFKRCVLSKLNSDDCS
ncbi:LysR family transcriptional regulator [Pseudomonas putida]|uniref:LysR family transcriptional regulator n=1 Tax=Pseudomonas putida TaxID=303 RepID=UPI00300F52CE